MRDLSHVPETGFDAVICGQGPASPVREEDLVQAAAEVCNKLQTGGVFVGSIRDYDRLIEERPVVQGPACFSDNRRYRFQGSDSSTRRRRVYPAVASKCQQRA